MRKRLRVCLSFIAAMLLCIAMSLCIAACAEDPNNPPVKVSDGTSAELSVGETETFAVADYITANGNPVTVESSDDAVATAAVAEDALTITAEAEGEATVTLSCADISVTFQVTVYRTYTVSVDGVETQVRSGAEFTLPQASVLPLFPRAHAGEFGKRRPRTDNFISDAVDVENDRFRTEREHLAPQITDHNNLHNMFTLFLSN